MIYPTGAHTLSTELHNSSKHGWGTHTYTHRYTAAVSLIHQQMWKKNGTKKLDCIFLCQKLENRAESGKKEDCARI